MSPKQINVALRNLFNGNGFDAKGFKIKSESPLVANIEHEGSTTVIKFGENKPRAEIKKFITLRAYIEQIIFAEHGGSIKLKNFPDISFGYDNNSLIDLITDNFCGESSDCDSLIDEKYSDSNHREIAKKCWQYAEEWSKICVHSDVDFKSASNSEKSKYRQSCYNFVKDNIENDVQDKYSSVFLTFIFLYVILPAIISWVVHRVLDKLFTE